MKLGSWFVRTSQPCGKLGMRWMGVVGALLTACAAPRAYYAGTLEIDSLPSDRRSELVLLLAEKLDRAGVTAIEVRDGGGPPLVRVRPEKGVIPLDDLPFDALQLAFWGSTEDLRGAEIDICVAPPAVPDAPSMLWSVRHELDGRLVVERGPQLFEADKPELTSQEISERFGIGPLEDRDVAWSSADRRALAEALELLSPAERELLFLLPFARASVGPTTDHAGLYERAEDAAGGRIVLFDRAFDGAGGYVGGPQRAHAYPVFVILHEIGHALAKLYRERVLLQYQKDIATYNELVPRVNEYVEAYNKLDAALLRGRRIDAVDRAKWELDRERLRVEIARIKKVLRRARSHFDKVERMVKGPTPMEQAYSDLTGRRGGPTPYGDTSVSESFAEAFALYHVDPDALRRVSPAAHDWFAQGGHTAVDVLATEAAE